MSPKIISLPIVDDDPVFAGLDRVIAGRRAFAGGNDFSNEGCRPGMEVARTSGKG